MQALDWSAFVWRKMKWSELLQLSSHSQLYTRKERLHREVMLSVSRKQLDRVPLRTPSQLFYVDFVAPKNNIENKVSRETI